MARATALVLLAAAACLLRNLAFVPAPKTTPTADPAVAAGAAVLATVPMGADAFVFKGKEYFDVFYGIEPLAWAFCGFVIVYYGAALKNAATKYAIPIDRAPPKVGGFQGKEIENNEDMEKFYKK
eukprot:CAMPEP_0114659748 /NCGR_PEP_ID=MMETSP0191-20121206/18455_1 /TAXON_ID=126664 /ORGANISM="Sorites sp." /LENGTH=124 /DNA_ID=CAMNT_0001885875 /DNA_START=44 /DNA_END=418 /DNA_ORIENTATION=+